VLTLYRIEKGVICKESKGPTRPLSRRFYPQYSGINEPFSGVFSNHRYTGLAGSPKLPAGKKICRQKDLQAKKSAGKKICGQKNLRAKKSVGKNTAGKST
jgi:hypothetical protein